MHTEDDVKQKDQNVSKRLRLRNKTTAMFVWTQHNKQQLSEPTVLIKALQKVLKNILPNAPVDKNKKKKYRSRETTTTHCRICENYERNENKILWTVPPGRMRGKCQAAKQRYSEIGISRLNQHEKNKRILIGDSLEEPFMKSTGI